MTVVFDTESSWWIILLEVKDPLTKNCNENKIRKWIQFCICIFETKNVFAVKWQMISLTVHSGCEKAVIIAYFFYLTHWFYCLLSMLMELIKSFMAVVLTRTYFCLKIPRYRLGFVAGLVTSEREAGSLWIQPIRADPRGRVPWILRRVFRSCSSPFAHWAGGRRGR